LVREPKVSIRLLHRCNYRCPACSTFSGPDGQGELSLGDFGTAVDVLAAAGFHGQLNLSGGEPTLHPFLPDMLGRAAARLPDAQIAVFTNGHWVGDEGWEGRLAQLLAGPNVLVRFSLDRQHAEGLVRSCGGGLDVRSVQEAEHARLAKAGAFLRECLSRGAAPGRNFDFAFKGTEQEGRQYTASLGQVPLYLIRFRPRPEQRPRQWGFLAIDVDAEGTPLVYPTLGHIPAGEPLGGLDALASALEMNRREMRGAKSHA
jgi:hypothetical protein